MLFSSVIGRASESERLLVGWIGNGTDESELFLFVDVRRVRNGADELELLLFSRVGIKSDESELLLVGIVSNGLTEAAHE